MYTCSQFQVKIIDFFSHLVRQPTLAVGSHTTLRSVVMHWSAARILVVNNLALPPVGLQ